MEVHKLGLRERKHIETRSRLEEAALSLAIKEGLDKTTIDAISEAANVSARTFFNYFDSKEDAILGVYLTDKNEEDGIKAVQLNQEQDIVSSVAELIISLINPSKNSQQLKKRRARLIRQYPALLERQISRMTKINDALNSKVRSIVVLKYPHLDEASVAATSEVIVMTCAGGVKVAMKEWLLGRNEMLTSDVQQRAIEIIKDTMKVL